MRRPWPTRGCCAIEGGGAKVAVNGELETMRMGVVVLCFMTLSLHIAGRDE